MCASLRANTGHVRFAPNSGSSQGPLTLRICVITGLMQCSKRRAQIEFALFVLAFRETVVDRDVPPSRKARCLESLYEWLSQPCTCLRRSAAEISYHRHRRAAAFERLRA